VPSGPGTGRRARTGYPPICVSVAWEPAVVLSLHHPPLSTIRIRTYVSSDYALEVSDVMYRSTRYGFQLAVLLAVLTQPILVCPAIDTLSLRDHLARAASLIVVVDPACRWFGCLVHGIEESSARHSHPPEFEDAVIRRSWVPLHCPLTPRRGHFRETATGLHRDPVDSHVVGCVPVARFGAAIAFTAPVQ